NLWNGNAFYPDKYSYVFSDTLFGYFPAGLFGNGPSAALVRYNVVFILLHALAFIGPYALVRQLGAGRTAAALAGAAFAYAPWRWGQAGHMHVLSKAGSCWRWRCSRGGTGTRSRGASNAAAPGSAG